MIYVINVIKKFTKKSRWLELISIRNSDYLFENRLKILDNFSY